MDYLSTAAPDQNALNMLQTRLQERCNKPGGVTVLFSDSITSTGITTWTIADVQNVENQHRNNFSSGSQAVLYVLYVDAQSDQDTQSSRVLGLSYSGSAFCIFKDNIRASAAGLVTEPIIERAVIVHEAGHNLGLVNNGIPMQVAHQDVANGAHDSDSSCVMHYTIETSLIAQILGTVPDQFDQRCIDDMRAAGGL